MFKDSVSNSIANAITYLDWLVSHKEEQTSTLFPLRGSPLQQIPEPAGPWQFSLLSKSTCFNSDLSSISQDSDSSQNSF